MDLIARNLAFVDLAIKRHAYLRHFAAWIDETLKKIDNAKRSNVDLPDYVNHGYATKLMRHRADIEQQMLRDGETVLRMARNEGACSLNVSPDADERVPE